MMLSANHPILVLGGTGNLGSGEGNVSVLDAAPPELCELMARSAQ